MESSGLEPKRLSTRGFGEYRPVAPNAAGNKGNPQNRRVEIFIVPSGL
jgi:flagellar motor protein MotB